MIPPYINFIFSHKGVNIPNLIVYLSLNVKDKNNYTIGPLITNETGEIILTKKQVENTMNQYNLNFPMDYVGSVDSCTGIEIVVESYDELRNRILVLQDFYPQNALLLENAIKNCTNQNFRVYKKIQFPIIDKDVFVYIDE